MSERVWDKYHYTIALVVGQCAEILQEEDVEWTDEAFILGRFDAAINNLKYAREFVVDLLKERE